MRVLRSALPLVLFTAFGTDFAPAQSSTGATRLVDVGGYPTRVVELGVRDRESGEPVLVLLAGAGSPLETWQGWLNDVADLAPVVSYDRPGIGGSTFDELEASPAHLVEHAHAVLEALSIPPPYVLVGHSWGGTLALHYAGRYPREVVGVVYLDPFDPLEPPRPESGSRIPPGANLPPGLRAEAEGIQTFQDTPIEDRSLPPDPDVPTGVLLGTRAPTGQGPPPWTPAYWNDWMTQRLARYAQLVRDRRYGTLIVASDAGHFVHHDVPALATDLVRTVLEAARER
jgi:pimeloyl-ACP methyl ester carboxylesterase